MLDDAASLWKRTKRRVAVLTLASHSVAASTTETGELFSTDCLLAGWLGRLGRRGTQGAHGSDDNACARGDVQRDVQRATTSSTCSRAGSREARVKAATTDANCQLRKLLRASEKTIQAAVKFGLKERLSAVLQRAPPDTGSTLSI
ncbi:hypothetical protein ACCO45_009627 [Purpureocillium lilacinum]|uniref:Uncharacterized protein n=1 Tax=Purpureocillium lilacinum TaxID=33203 RepID=A0ACC4DKJ4_PURLI